MKKKLIVMAFALASLLVAAPAFAYGPPLNNPYAGETGVPLTVHVDGRYVSTDVDPYLSGGRTYLPLRAAAEAMGASVRWDGGTNSAIVTKDGTSIVCTIGSGVFYVNGVANYSDAAPQNVQGRTMLPIRPIAEALGGTLEWDGYTASVSIDTPAADAPSPSLPSNIPSQVRWLVEKYYVEDDGDNGSWMYNATDKVHAGLRYDNNYVFISEMKNGKKNAVVVGYSEFDGMGNVGVDSMEVTETLSGYTLKDTWTPHYWHGAGIGCSPGYTMVDYTMKDNGNLTLSKSSFMGSPMGTQTYSWNYTFTKF